MGAKNSQELSNEKDHDTPAKKEYLNLDNDGKGALYTQMRTWLQKRASETMRKKSSKKKIEKFGLLLCEIQPKLLKLIEESSVQQQEHRFGVTVVWEERMNVGKYKDILQEALQLSAAEEVGQQEKGPCLFVYRSTTGRLTDVDLKPMERFEGLLLKDP